MIFGIPIILAIIAFVFVIFIHELGHYLMGRFCGIGATSFSIGFGPKLISFTDRHNTEWMICLIPLGGYVKFQTNSESTDKDLVFKNKKRYWRALQANKLSFEDSSILARALTVFAGPLANFLMAAFIFAFVYQVNGIMSDQPIVGDVVNLPSGQVSLIPGDKILSVQGKKIEKSLSMLEKANALKVNDPFIIDSLGWALFKLKKYSESKNYLQTAVQLLPADPTVNDHYGDVLWKTGNKIQARYYWNYVLSLKDTKDELKKNIKGKLIFGL